MLDNALDDVKNFKNKQSLKIVTKVLVDIRSTVVPERIIIKYSADFLVNILCECVQLYNDQKASTLEQ